MNHRQQVRIERLEQQAAPAFTAFERIPPPSEECVAEFERFTREMMAVPGYDPAEHAARAKEYDRALASLARLQADGELAR